MSKKSVWQTVKSVWKAIVGLSVILSIASFVLQVWGIIDFWRLLVLPLYVFFTTKIPIYYVVLFVAICIVIYSVTRTAKKPKSCILDFTDGRKIALVCQTPRTTDFLRQQYDYWKSQERGIFIGGYGFDDYMKRLEKEGFLKYIDGTWQVTTKALEYVKKYHGK